MKKSRENDPARLEHMLAASGAAASLAGGWSRGEVAADLQLQLALRYLVLVIGEAANQLTEDLKRRHDHIAWIPIIGMRHRLVHGYHEIDFEIV